MLQRISVYLSNGVESRREKKLRATACMLDAVGEDYDWHDRNTIAEATGTGYYHAAVLTPRTVLVNPAALCRGLGETLPGNVELYEHTPVSRVEPGSPARIECAEGSVRARNVLLTTNAFIARLGLLRRAVFPMIACASLSRPMTEDEQAAMGGESEWGITGVTTMRRTRSNRILVRHGLGYTWDFRLSDGRRRQLVESHAVILKKRFPMLAELDFEHTRAGVFCMTRNRASHFGRLEPEVFVSLGYCGVGLPRGTISGRLLAEHALGLEWSLIADVRALSRPTPLPAQPFLGIGVRARGIGGRRRPDRRGNPRPRRAPERTGLVRPRHGSVHDPAEIDGRLVRTARHRNARAAGTLAPEADTGRALAISDSMVPGVSDEHSSEFINSWPIDGN